MNALVTLDVPTTTLVTRPQIPAGELKLSDVEKYAPGLARELHETYDFRDSVERQGHATLSVAKAYSIVPTKQYLQLAKIAERVGKSNDWYTGWWSGFTLAATGLFGAVTCFPGDVGVAVGVASAIAGAVSLYCGCGAEGHVARKEQIVKNEVAAIERETPLLTHANKPR